MLYFQQWRDLEKQSELLGALKIPSILLVDIIW